MARAKKKINKGGRPTKYGEKTRMMCFRVPESKYKALRNACLSVIARATK